MDIFCMQHSRLCGVIEATARRRRLRLFNHVARFPDLVLANVALRLACDVREGTLPDPDWRRFPGRLPTIGDNMASAHYTIC